MSIAVSGLWDYRISSLGAQGLSDGIVKRVSDTYPDDILIRLNVVSHLPRAGFLIRIFGRNKLFYSFLFKIIYKKYCKLYSKRIEQIEKLSALVMSCDGIVADIFQFDTCMLACDIKAAMENNVKVVSLNQSMNVSKGSFAGYCVERYFLPNALSVREPDSADVLLDEFGYACKNISLDAAFLVDKLSQAENQIYNDYLTKIMAKYRLKPDYIVLGIRGNRPLSQSYDIKDWVNILHEIQDLWPDKDIVFASTACNLDINVGRSLAEEFPKLVVIEDYIDFGRFNYRFFIYFLSQALFSISDRYHQNVFAALCATPFIAFEANTSKTQGLRDLLKYPIDILTLDTLKAPTQIKQTLNYLYNNYNEIKSKLPDLLQEAISAHDNYTSILQEVY